MVNNSNRFLIAFTVCTAALFSQSRIDNPGVSLDGSTGLFLNPSPETLSVGHVRLGSSRSFSYLDHNLNSTIPLAISLGLTPRSELYYSTNSLNISNIEKEKNMTLGIRLKLWNFENSILSADFRWQNIELSTDTPALQKSQRFISRAVTNFTILNFKTYVNLGYISALESTGLKIDNRFIGGIGLLFPIVKRVQGVIDLQVDEHEAISKNVVGSIAIKWFLLDHMQLATGFNSDINRGEPLTGIFVNLSISSELMKGPRKRIRTSKGLPIPPKLPKEYYTSTMLSEEPNIKYTKNVFNEKLPLSLYIEKFIEKDYTNDLPIIPPITQLDLWREEVLNVLDKKSQIKSDLKEGELPLPPPLNINESHSYQDSVVKKQVKVMSIPENDIIALPKPPPLESLDW